MNYVRQTTSSQISGVFALLLFLLVPFSVQGAPLNTNDDAALVALYNATGGASWTNNTGWSGSAGVMVDGLGGGTPPAGVSIDPATGRVTQIYFSNNILSGNSPYHRPCYRNAFRI